MNIKRFFQGRMGAVAICIAEILVGVLLLIDPVRFTSGIIIGAGVLMALAGAVNAVRYFLLKPDAAAQRQLLFRGLLLIMAGAVCITKADWFLSAFPLLTVLYAGVMLILAAARLQRMSDMLRLKQPRWYLPGIAAVLAAALAAIILINPFSAATAMWTFVALSVIAEAVVDLAAVILR